MAVNPNLAKRFGLSLVWNSQDREECRSHHAPIWERIRENSGASRVEDIPGFLNSLQRLILYGYSLVDIGVMFGLSNERIRQYADKHNLLRHGFHGSMYRIWNDGRNCFVPVAPEDMGEILYEVYQEKKSKRFLRRIRREQLRHVRTICSFARRNSRPPTLKELSELLGYKRGVVASIAFSWGYQRDNNVSYSEAFNRLYVAAGFNKRRGPGSVVGELRPRRSRKPNTLGARLTQRRLESGLGQEAVAIETGLCVASVTNHERSKQHPSKEVLRKYAELFSVSEKWLLEGKD